MQLTVGSVDYAPAELHEQTPFVIDLMYMIPGSDRPDYWLGSVKSPLRWLKDNIQREVKYVVIAARWQGTRIEQGVEHLPIYIAYVTDESLLSDHGFDLRKAEYVAIGMASDTSGGAQVKQLDRVMGGRIAPAFGTGKSK